MEIIHVCFKDKGDSEFENLDPNENTLFLFYEGKEFQFCNEKEKLKE
jgi:hypothetical protein